MTNTKTENKTVKSNFSQFIYRNKKGLATISSVVVGLAVSCIVLVIMGYNPIDLISHLVKGSFSTTENTWQTIQTWSVFLILGLAVGIGFKAGLFNIGVAGQMVFGATMGYLFVYSHSDMNPGALIGIMTVIALVSAVAFGVVAGILKSVFGVHEVISTIMLNWIAVKLAKGLIERGDIPKTNSTLTPLPDGVSTTIGSISPYITWALFAAIVIVLATFILFKYTKLGMKIKISGNNMSAGKYAGFKSKTIVVGVMGLSALIAGVAAVTYYFGEVNTSLSPLPAGHFDMPPVIGFTGIAIALIALNNPFAMIPVALLFAVTQGPAALNGIPYGTPREIGELFSAIIIYFVAISNVFIHILTPKKVKDLYVRITNFFKNETIKVSTKIWVSIANIFTLGIYTYAINNWKWTQKKDKQEAEPQLVLNGGEK